MNNKLTKDTYKGALKTANQLYNRALARNDQEEEVARWCVERNRILVFSQIGRIDMSIEDQIREIAEQVETGARTIPTLCSSFRLTVASRRGLSERYPEGAGEPMVCASFVGFAISMIRRVHWHMPRR